MKKSSTFCSKKFGSPGKLKGIQHFVIALLFIILVGGITIDTAHAQSLTQNGISNVSIADGDEWYFWVGANTPLRAWNSNGFDVSGWKKGPSGFGYGPGANRTYLADMQGNYSTVYIRKEFNINNLQRVAGMKLTIVCDGPFIAYINGIEVIRTNTVQISPPEQQLTLQQAEQFDISGFAHELFPHENVLAVECSNDDINSIDFSLLPLLDVLVNEEGR